MLFSVYLLPLLPLLYLALWQDPALRFDSHLFHEAVIALATLEGCALTYVCWLSYQRSGEMPLKRMTQGFMAFTVVYSLHGMFTPVADHHLALFILYGPASRLLMGALLWLSVQAQNQAVESRAQRSSLGFWWRFLGFLVAVNVAVAVLATSAWGEEAWPRMGMEAGALVCSLAALARMGTRPAGTPLMRHYRLALAWFATASLCFLLAAPWNHLWWLAHGIFVVGFSILGYGVLKAYLSTHALERVFSSEELFEDLAKVQVQLVDVLQEQAHSKSALQDLSLEVQRARHSFTSLLAAVPDAVLIVETGGRILQTNGAADQLFGYAPGALVGQSVDTLMPADLRDGHAKKRQQFAFAPRTRAMGSSSTPLRCLRQDGHEFLADISIGSLMFEGQQCVVTLLRCVTPQQEAFAQQRARDLQQIERGQLLDALLAVAPSMLFALQRRTDGSYVCAVHSDACAAGLHVAHEASPSEWTQQWFNRVVPGDLPQLISALETGALTRQPLALQWRHHVPGHGTQRMRLHSGTPQELADGSQVWLCSLAPAQEAQHGE
jgi:PAS domain S-box-containing protein